jgi:hypothetical protein
LLLVDDINWLGGSQQTPVPQGWRLVHQSGNSLKTTGVWQKPPEVHESADSPVHNRGK